MSCNELERGVNGVLMKVTGETTLETDKKNKEAKELGQMDCSN